LELRLERCKDTGVALVAWAELKRWYNIQRVARNTWRDIKTRAEELGIISLHIIENGGLTLINGDILVDVDQKI